MLAFVGLSAHLSMRPSVRPSMHLCVCLRASACNLNPIAYFTTPQDESETESDESDVEKEPKEGKKPKVGSIC